jgi:RNA polymerase sigma-54 factor
MKQSLQFRLSQHLALTPQLQQSIRLLQLSTLELNQELEQILGENPLLERLDDPLDACLRIAPNGGLEAAGVDTAASADSSRDAAGGEPLAGDRGESGADRSRESNDASGDAPGERDAPHADGPADADDGYREPSGDWGSEWGHGQPGDGDGDDDRGFPQVAGAGETLREHLLAQLAGTGCSRRDRALVTLLIEELDADGQLGLGLDEMLAILPDELEFEPEELSAALRLLQSFDPPGIGARSLSECLQLQLAALPADRAIPAVMACADAIVRAHLELLAARDFTRLKRALHCDDDVLRDAQALIRSLDPRPGSRFASDPPAYVVPDVIVRRTRSGWTASLNPDVMPRLRINDVYAQILRRHRNGPAGGLNSQLQEARWLIKNVQQRFDTIQRVAQAIVDRQRAFFTHGAVAMRPLVLREIADILELHESTVSRVTTQKYMLTPFGTLEMKYFFGSHVATDTGGAASSTAIRAIIKQLISEEDARTPLSDSRIADMLGEQGIVVARRTVAKYREAMQIAPVAQRRAL